MIDSRDDMRDDSDEPNNGSGDGRLRLAIGPPKTVLGWIIVANLIVFALQRAGFLITPTRWDLDGTVLDYDPWGGLSFEALLSGRLWTLVTHMFVHLGVLHISCNLLMIWLCGRPVMEALGQRQFLAIYFIAGLAGAALQFSLHDLLFSTGALGRSGAPVATYLIGASGAAFGLLVTFAVLTPDRDVLKLLFFVIPARLRARSLAWGLVLVEAFLAVLALIFVAREVDGGFLISGIAHLTHLGGALAGYLFTRLLGYGSFDMELDRLREERARREAEEGEVDASPASRRRRRNRRLRTKNRQVTTSSSGGRTVFLSDDAEEAVPEPEPLVVGSPEFIAQQVDPILEKINSRGMDSLSDTEREILFRCQKEIERRDL